MLSHDESPYRQLIRPWEQSCRRDWNMSVPLFHLTRLCRALQYSGATCHEEREGWGKGLLWSSPQMCMLCLRLRWGEVGESGQWSGVSGGFLYWLKYSLTAHPSPHGAPHGAQRSGSDVSLQSKCISHYQTPTAVNSCLLFFRSSWNPLQCE